jgi:pimeloyl-ACP methyl ester carboxylesterase
MILQLRRNPIPVLAEFYKNVHHPYRASRTAPGCSPNELVAGLEYLQASDVRQKVPTLGIPVLLLHGAQDRIIPATAAEWLHKHLPDSRLKIFKNDGHALPAHHYAEVMTAMGLFLRD